MDGSNQWRSFSTVTSVEMTSLCRNLAVLLLFLSASPLHHSHLSTHAASTFPPATRPPIIVMTALGSDDDYDDYSSPPEDVHAVTTTLLQREAQPCQYNPCLENQEPCKQISAKTGCLCPGVSRVDEPPHAPIIQALQPISEGDDRGKIEVQWCAPSSVLSGYRVVIEGSESLEFGEGSRRGLVGSLEVGTKVCVEAWNSAGHSPSSEFSCKRYTPPESSEHKLLAGVIGGGMALLLLIIAVVILCNHQMRKKAKKDSADGLGNPSYTVGTM
ncbi:LRRN4 C-terminal-like protein isoform X1 [Perca fluviatilis]|uniref:LRRN4 C-terminal-like protein isoform X1 n=2 Tax=Perca fluviatilis TaxID=8168 RepID=UPI00196699B1|nr:LRRN4 C-terminal-like protein isoform X1 [Perca fluviatilis]